jgi:hypothetical protein
LSQIISDVALALADFEKALDFLRDVLVGKFSTSAPAVDQLAQLARPEVATILQMLHVTAAPTHAKQRLELERSLESTLPRLYASVSHWELLVDSFYADAVAMSLPELLSSRPDRGSERPYRAVRFCGDLMSRDVLIPPRVGLGALGAWMSIDDSTLEQFVVVSVREDELRFQKSTSSSPELTARLPVFVATPHTQTTVDAALRPHGGSLTDDILVLRAVV